MTSFEAARNLTNALSATSDIVPTIAVSPFAAVFVGSGDSLSSALLAQAYGHRSLSSGDITFMGTLPIGAETVVGISYSGTSGGTVQALRLARAAGARTIAITSNAESPLADAADELQLVPSLQLNEIIPCAGHLMLGLGVAAVCGENVQGAAAHLAECIGNQFSLADSTVARLPRNAPVGVSLLSLPDLRGAADFWMLKLIEATGITVRTVALEESGHVDYFIGPEPRLIIQLVGLHGRARFDRLATALTSTGATVVVVEAPPPPRESTSRAGDSQELAGAALGTLVAEAAARRWNRPPFRGGAVNMDASHIKLDGQPVN